VRIVSSNLQHGVPDPIGRPALKRAVSPLRALAADVYAFQELDRGRWRTRLQHQGARLAEALDGELVWARAKHWLWASQANALVVRGEVVGHEVVTLPGPGERRVAILATVVVRGARWSLATTHLSLEPRVATRQLEVTLDGLADRPPPHVLVGDLNLLPERVGSVAAAVGWTMLDGPHTINARTGLNRRLDHVLLHGAHVLDSGVHKLPVSDHLAVWADLAPASASGSSVRAGGC
jgi:endonuclease/exonuclease/phosphatase family metal-dependent hydrolase